MANYERYQTISSAEQYLYSPSCPVWVSRYQISWDTQSSARLLQCRMVNVSEKSISAVYLRVLCRDAQGQDITTLHLVPITGLYITPGAIFGDDKIVTLWPKRTAYAEIYPERVCFSDDTAWNEQEPMDYLAIPAPSQVQPLDRAYPQLALAAREGGVRNDFYFRQLKNLWLCTCGVPNSNQMPLCRHCGAERAWLEQHMDPENIVQPTPVVKEPEPEPEPAPVAAAPLEKFDLVSYLNAEPMQPSAEDEFPDIQTYPSKEDVEDDYYDDEEEEEKKPERSRAGRIAAIVLAVLLFLGVGGYLIAKQFLGPYSTYQKAVEAENTAAELVKSTSELAEQEDADKQLIREQYESAIGGYQDAITLYEEVPDYEDSQERVEACKVQIGLTKMRMGDYEDAYEDLKQFPDYQVYAADCLYSLGVLAYNGGDYDGAWTYVGRLQQEYPDYENLQQLHDCCCYEFGKTELERVNFSSDRSEYPEFYNKAKDWFTQAGSYSNSDEMILYCDYYLADLLLQEAEEYGDTQRYLDAAEAFRMLGTYSDSDQRRKECLYDYCMAVNNLDDADCARYLTELAAEDYPGAQQLLEELSRLEVTVDVLYGDNAAPSKLLIRQLEDVAIRYHVTGYGTATVEITMVYTIPGAGSGRTTLTRDNERFGYFTIYDLFSERPSEPGEVKLQFFNAETGEEIKTVYIQLTEEEST